MYAFSSLTEFLAELSESDEFSLAKQISQNSALLSSHMMEAFFVPHFVAGPSVKFR